MLSYTTRLILQLICAAALSIWHTSALAADPYYIKVPKTLKPPPLKQDWSKANVLQLPRKPGPEADKALVDFAVKLESLDQSIIQSSKERKLTSAQLSAVVEARNVISEELANQQQILSNTSGGNISQEKRSQIDSYVALLMKAMAAPPTKENVRTTIEYGGNTAKALAILYQSYQDHRAKAAGWTTYTPDDPLRIGTYIFQVREIDGTRSCDETVLVMDDPTKKKICGAFKP